MSSNNNTTIKIFFENDIRRISISSASPTLVQLLETVKTILSSRIPSKDSIKVQYIDEDNDKITVSSEAEWSEALFALQDAQVKKIYVSVDKSIKHKKLAHKTCQAKPPLVVCPRPRRLQFEEMIEKIAQGAEVDFLSFGNDLVKLPHVLQFRSIQMIEKKQYTKAENLLKAAIKIEPHSEINLYNLACVYSLTGNGEEACRYLSKSVEAGYKNLAHLEKDADLDFIRGMKDYQDIVAGLKKKCPIRYLMHPLPTACMPIFQINDEKPQEDKIEEKVSEAQLTEEIKVVEAEPAVAEVEEAFKEQMKILGDMGFTDRELNNSLLEKENGDVEAVINFLLNSLN